MFVKFLRFLPTFLTLFYSILANNDNAAVNANFRSNNKLKQKPNKPPPTTPSIPTIPSTVPKALAVLHVPNLFADVQFEKIKIQVVSLLIPGQILTIPTKIQMIPLTRRRMKLRLGLNQHFGGVRLLEKIRGVIKPTKSKSLKEVGREV